MASCAAGKALKVIMIDRRVAIAPMMAWTDRHFRYLVRLISQKVLLYTEMVHADALLHQRPQRFLAYDELEHPLALQLGGHQPQSLAACARLAQAWGFDEVNLNIGCPSPKVQRGAFGACLMAEPECIASMQQEVTIPVTVKTRIGIDEQDSWPALQHFIATVANAGCKIFIIHARKAWLQGLSPKQNREIPPLKYDWVYRLQSVFPELTFILNGGLKDLRALQSHVQDLSGVMIGREAYQNPYALSVIDNLYYQQAVVPRTRLEIVNSYLPYIEQQLTQGVPLNRMAKHLLTLFQGQPGAKAWRRALSLSMHQQGATAGVIREALQHVSG